MDEPTEKQVVGRFDAHHRFIIACGAAALALAGLHGHGAFTTQLVAVWDIFAFTILATTWFVLWTEDPYEVRRYASLQDSSRTFLFVVVVSAATICLFAVLILLSSSKRDSTGHFAMLVGLSFSAIMLSWILVHTLFTLRYAHLYFIDALKLDREKIKGGLDFPGDEEPDYFDFAYFSFVIGMTCQVSDVQITSKIMRRLSIVHGLISFVFNTAILAMFVNIVAGLI